MEERGKGVALGGHVTAHALVRYSDSWLDTMFGCRLEPTDSECLGSFDW